ncbi:major facilitator superfamily domain-containing protein [Lentinula aciculospora]|uniref:Major facilitator superfamily domain-containing protein n=1 Tax=Lentinula aciculospora TaxID=153920 RepID=A0A9W9DRE5_9AGAR|nr:major facilitator superfamily domain-containing protein [Lentinula aciculospora]
MHQMLEVLHPFLDCTLWHSKVAHPLEKPDTGNNSVGNIFSQFISRRWTFIALVIALNLATFIAALDNTIVATAIPTITSQFHSIGDVGWYGSIYMLAMTPLQPILGKVYNMFNTKYVYILAIIIFEVGSIIGASAPQSSVLVIGRAVAGVGATTVFAGGMAIVTNIFPEDQRPLHISFLQSMFGIANMVGPLLGGLLTDALSWRWCFWINVPLGFIVVLIVLFCYDDQNNQQKISLTIHEKIRRLDILGSALLITSVTCLLLALHWGGTTYSWDSPRIVCLVTLAAVLICAFGISQYMRPQSASIVYASALYMFFLTIGRFTHIYYLPFYFQICKGVSPISSGLRFLPYSITATLSTILLGAIINANGFCTLVQLTGAVLFTVGSGLIASFRLNTSAGTWIGYQILAGAGAGAGVQTPYITAQTAVASEDVHTTNAIIMFMTGLGGALSISIAQNIFATVLLEELPEYTIAEINGGEILNLGEVLQAFAHALDKTFIVSIVAGSVCVLLAFSIVRKRRENTDRCDNYGHSLDTTRQDHD